MADLSNLFDLPIVQEHLRREVRNMARFAEACEGRSPVAAILERANMSRSPELQTWLERHPKAQGPKRQVRIIEHWTDPTSTQDDASAASLNEPYSTLDVLQAAIEQHEVATGSRISYAINASTKTVAPAGVKNV